MGDYAASYAWNPERQKMEWRIVTPDRTGYLDVGFKTRKAARAYIAEHLTTAKEEKPC